MKVTNPRIHLQACNLADTIERDWRGLGYGWEDPNRAIAKTLTCLQENEVDNPQTVTGLINWGIGGNRHRGSKLYILGVWANMLKFFYAAYFGGLSRSELDKMILWAQQEPDLLNDASGKFCANDVISEAMMSKDKNPDEELKKIYFNNPKEFINRQWKSLINSAGPGIAIVDPEGNPVSPKDICKYAMEGMNFYQYSEICNMAWLEEFYTRRELPGMLYDHLNEDELIALYHCMKKRISLCNNQLFNHVPHNYQRVIRHIFEKLVVEFFCNVWRNTTCTKIMRSEGHHPEISGILKKAGNDITLTGTGKELFYLLSKGATPIICGERLFLVPHISPDSPKEKYLNIMNDKLTEIINDENTRCALDNHYEYPEEKSYVKLFNTRNKKRILEPHSFKKPLYINQIIPIDKLDEYIRVGG